MLNPSSFASHLPPSQTPHTVVKLKEGTTTVEVTEKTKTRLYIGTPVQGLRPNQPSIPSQYDTTQFQERNITSTEPSYCSLNQGMLTPSSNNPHSPACTRTDTLSSGASLSSISSDGMQFTIHHRPCEDTTSTVMTAPLSHNQNSQLPPISQFAQTTEHLFPHSQQSSGLRPDSQNPFLSREFTRSNSTPSTPAPYPQATGMSSESQQLTHFPQYMMNHLSHQASHEQQQLVPQSNSLVSPLHSQELSMPSTQALSVRPALDINNPSTSTVNRHDPAKKSPQQLQAVAKTVSNALVPALKMDLSSTVKETMPILLREQLETDLSDAVRSMMPDILREQLKSEVTGAVAAIMPAIREQMSQAASSIITTAISEFQRAVSDSATSIMETQLEASREVVNELTEQQASAFEEVFSDFKERQERTEAAASSMAGFMESSMKETQEETQKKLLEQSRKSVQDVMEGELKTLKETISTLKEQEAQTQATARQTAETLKRTTDDLKAFVNAQTEMQKAAPAPTRLDFPQREIPTEEAPFASTSSNMVQESPDGPPTKKMRTSGVSCTKPVPDVEVKRTNLYVEQLSNEVSRAMGIRPLTTNECTTGQLLLLAARLINDDKELLIQAAKPRPKTAAGNDNVQEQDRKRRYKGKRMQDKINSGFQELEKSVRRFSQDHLKEKLPDSYDTPYEIIQTACAILNDQNINDPERSSVIKGRLRSAGERANLSEFYKNAKALLAKEDREKKQF